MAFAPHTFTEERVHAELRSGALCLLRLLCTSYHLISFHGSAFSISQKNTSFMRSLLVIIELKHFLKSSLAGQI